MSGRRAVPGWAVELPGCFHAHLAGLFLSQLCDPGTLHALPYLIVEKEKAKV